MYYFYVLFFTIRKNKIQGKTTKNRIKDELKMEEIMNKFNVIKNT